MVDGTQNTSGDTAVVHGMIGKMALLCSVSKSMHIFGNVPKVFVSVRLRVCHSPLLNAAPTYSL